MIFWTIVAILALIVAVFLAQALMGGRDIPASDGGETGFDISIYRDQLAAVERDLARGVVSADEAERIRTEVKRRILEADRGRAAPSAIAPRGLSRIVALGAGMCVVAGSLGLYVVLGQPGYSDQPIAVRKEAAETRRANRPSQAELEAALPATPPVEVDPAYQELIAQLRATVAERPDDLQGQILLARHETQLGNLPAAHAAQGAVLRLKADAATAQDYATYAAMLIQSAGGIVSAKADDALAEALRRDPGNMIARYYVGLMHLQTGRPDLTFRFWQRLLADSAPNAPWVGPIRAEIENIAALAGVDYTLPPLAPVASAPLRGPSAEDVEAASDMSAEDRAQMIEGMVAQLADRLATEGGPPEDWARLIRAQGVLGRTEDAAAIWAEAQQVFPDPAARSLIEAAARDAGVAE